MRATQDSSSNLRSLRLTQPVTTQPVTTQPVTTRGFTLVELIVVMGIIIAFAGFAAPNFIDFFRSRAIVGVKGEFVSAFQRARGKAVSEGRDISLVFFKEGVRLYDELNRSFVNSDWNPSDSPLASPKNGLFFVLGCASGMTSDNPEYSGDGKNIPSLYIPPYQNWSARQPRVDPKLNKPQRYNVGGLVKVTFRRDGTMLFGLGTSDVRSAEYRKKRPRVADIMIYQVGNIKVCYMDLKATGSTKSKLVSLEKPFYKKPKKAS